MSRLAFIPDAVLVREVSHVLDIAIRAKAGAEKAFGKNVIDPFAALFETSGFDIDHETWKASEMVRQSQKTLQNHVGTFHQQILGHVKGWKNLGVGLEIDLLCEDKKIIAEVKNKYSTVTGGKLKDMYHDLERLVMPKASAYKGYTAYFVTIIPKSPARFDKAFTPSDKSRGEKCAENELIRVIDGASFYHLVTGRKDALKELFGALPVVMEDILRKQHSQRKFKPQDVEQFKEYFSAAYN